MWLGCVVVVLCVVASGAEEDPPWWRTAVLYQVYPRSFKDSDGDGIGDLKGINQQADYFKDLGVTAIWLSPILKSPMADFGYDISDYKTIDRIFGNLDDFHELRLKLKELDIKLLLDLVPNHTSDEHPWFQKSVNKEAPYDNYYVWNSGKEDAATGQRVPPNNWVSLFSGSAWEWNEKRQQFYLHQFDAKQPDLNYRNPEVVREMDAVIQFWLEAGVDGFRVDAVPMLFEDAQFRDEPPAEGHPDQQDKIYTQNLPDTYILTRHWAELIYNFSQRDNQSRALFLEAYASPEDTAKYCGVGNLSFMQPFNFRLISDLNQSSQPEQFRDVILNYVKILPFNAPANWVIGNHDNPRVSEKFGAVLSDALNMLTMVLPGVKVVYYGEEIGMEGPYIRWNQTVDPMGLLVGPDHYQEFSRDPERTPMQWDGSLSAGFSLNATTWLPENPNYWWLNVAAQRDAPVSHLKVFQTMVKVRRDPVIQTGQLQVLAPDDNTLIVARTSNSSWYCLVINMGSFMKEYDIHRLMVSPLGLSEEVSVALASINSVVNAGFEVKKGSSIFLRPKGAILFKSGSSDEVSSGTLLQPTAAIVAVSFVFFYVSTAIGDCL